MPKTETFSALTGTVLSGLRYKTLSANLALTTGPGRTGALHVTNPASYTLSVNGVNVPINNSGVSLIEFFTVGGDIWARDKDGNAILTASGVIESAAPHIMTFTVTGPNQITVVFDEPANGTLAGFDADNGSPLTLTSFTGIGTDTWVIDVTETIADTDTVTWSYDATAGNVMDGSSNALDDDSGTALNLLVDRFAFADADFTGVASFNLLAPHIWNEVPDFIHPFASGQPALSKLPAGEDGGIIYKFTTESGTAISSTIGIKATNEPDFVVVDTFDARILIGGTSAIWVFDGPGSAITDNLGSADTDSWWGVVGRHQGGSQGDASWAAARHHPVHLSRLPLPEVTQ